VSPAKAEKPLAVLMVEDNLGYVRLTQEAFKDAHMPVEITVVRDGVEALNCLHRKGEYGNAPAPDLILLDLKLPRKNGHEVLAEIKADPGLKRIPVIVLTNSQADEDINSAYHLQASYYFTKPDDPEQFGHIIKLIRSLMAKRGEA
jgi:CheY-like chemotaxis protein